MSDVVVSTIEQTLQSLPGFFAGGAGIGSGLLFGKFLLEWIGNRADKREASIEKAADRVDGATKLLLENLQEQINSWAIRTAKLEAQLEECKTQHHEAQEEIAQLRGTLQGFGEFRQVEQLRIAATKLTTKMNDEEKK